MASAALAAVTAAAVLHTFPHDPTAFTQGLEYRDGFLYEGTGIQGYSSLRRIDLSTGTVLQSTAIEATYFGEGITVIGSRILQLTWVSHRGFIYDRQSLRQIGTFFYEGEGWGLANDGKNIFRSDGSARSHVLDAATLTEQRQIIVHDGDHEISALNELECVGGELYANVWHRDRIARIDPANGLVLGWIDLSEVVRNTPVGDPEAVLNGIAYDSAGNRLFITGKLWPEIYQIAYHK